jgi:hypothetical protein
MKLSLSHIKPVNALPFEKIAYLEIAKQLDPRLTAILLKELSFGNRICEAGVTSLNLDDPVTGRLSLNRILTSKDLSKADGLWVCLWHAFRKKYELPKRVVYVRGDYGTLEGGYPDEYRTTGAFSHSLRAAFSKHK